MKPNRTLCAIACVIAATCGMAACTQNGPYGGTRPGTTEQQSGAMPAPTTDASSRYDTHAPMGGTAPSSGESRNPGAQPATAY
ncbi:hypothetical protein [Burkholderia stagnalis]|uniref:hypothetical protein n=1 Tax=Burkholderia stagnalis TaxID=1503054 RepID=UPI000ADE73B4|nr:hypothetical protein [Burkholderia stagnalis]